MRRSIKRHIQGVFGILKIQCSLFWDILVIMSVCLKIDGTDIIIA